MISCWVWTVAAWLVSTKRGSHITTLQPVLHLSWNPCTVWKRHKSLPADSGRRQSWCKPALLSPYEWQSLERAIMAWHHCWVSRIPVDTELDETAGRNFFVFVFFVHFLFSVSLTLLGDESPTCPNSVEYTVSNVDSGISEYPCRLSKRKKEQLMLRNRQLYRSNPNMISKYQCLMLLGAQSENPTTCLCFLLKNQLTLTMATMLLSLAPDGPTWLLSPVATFVMMWVVFF